GAADDIARGRSTFMVEMVETAAILNQASERALVILDEIGRGTATFDGLSIAWATIEHLHESNRCRALFATHFHELTALAARLPRLFNATVRVKEWEGEEGRLGMHKRIAVVLLTSLAGAASAQAQSYPTRTITLTVTAAAGGVTDVVARALGQRLAEAWGQQVVIENKGGAAHVVGAQ